MSPHATLSPRHPSSPVVTFCLPEGVSELGALLVEAVARVRHVLEESPYRGYRPMADECLELAREFHRQWSSQMLQLDRISDQLGEALGVCDYEAVVRTLSWRLRGLVRLEPSEPLIEHLIATLESIHASETQRGSLDADRWHALAVVMTGSYQVVHQQALQVYRWLSEIRSLSQRRHGHELLRLLERPPI